MTLTRRLSFLALLLIALLVKATPAWADADADRAKIRAMRDSVLSELYEVHPGARAKINRSVGYAVFSNVGINVFFASVAGGHGVVVQKGVFKNSETFMKMASGGLGLGIGVKDFRAVFIFYDQQRLDEFINKGWDFSGQADAAAKSDDKGGSLSTAATVIPGVEIYQITENGLALQATLQGTKYWKDDDLN
jgi:lipid-binding SYLF domain-containing protein